MTENKKMTSMERTLAALQFREADKVPLFLLLSMYGAKERQITVREYFSDAALVAETQWEMHKKYRTDCLYAFFYAPLELEAWGGETLFVQDGPPNSGEPLWRKAEQIDGLEAPKLEAAPGMLRVLETIRLLKRRAGDSVPIIGVVMSPFSVPVMQMGFEAYLKLLYFAPQRFRRLMEVNSEFCVRWANAQLQAGATAICYFDPLAAPSLIDKALFMKTGYPVAENVLARINGPKALHLSSAPALPVVEEAAALGASVLGFSAQDDPEKIKKAAQGKITLLGSLNGIEMVRWQSGEAERQVKELLAKVGGGGGFLLGENHGEVPFQVSQDTLLEIAEATERWGGYPLKWVK